MYNWLRRHRSKLTKPHHTCGVVSCALLFSFPLATDILQRRMDSQPCQKKIPKKILWDKNKKTFNVVDRLYKCSYRSKIYHLVVQQRINSNIHVPEWNCWSFKMYFVAIGGFHWSWITFGQRWFQLPSSRMSKKCSAGWNVYWTCVGRIGTHATNTQPTHLFNKSRASYKSVGIFHWSVLKRKITFFVPVDIFF